MTAWLAEIRFGARVLWRNRTASIVSLVTLTLAIGATTGIFTVVDATLLRALPFPEADRLTMVARDFPQNLQESTSIPKFVFWRAHGGQVFSHMAAYDLLGPGFNFVADGRPDRVLGTHVSSDFFGAMGVPPALGRDFRADEDLPAHAKVVILSHDLWLHRFDGRPDLIGQAISLNGEPYTVIGVMPAGFRFPDKVSLWTLSQFDPGSLDKANYFDVVGRLRPGVTLAQANAAMHVAAEEFGRAHKDLTNPNETITVRPLRERFYGSLRTSLLVLLAAVGFVLLIACVNVAHLQLAQGVARTPEIALRAALGASTWSIIRPLLIENLLLAAISGIAGVLLAYLSVPVLLALSPFEVSQVARVEVDWRVLLVSLTMSLACGLFFGLLPGWQAARPDLDQVLRAGARGTVSGGSGWIRRGLIVSEVALALMLTIGSFLLVKSLAGLRSTDPGFTTESVVTMKLSLPEGSYRTSDALAQFQERVEARIAGTPGVRAVALTQSLPMENGVSMPVKIEDKYVPGTDKGVIGDAQYRAIAPAYFSALQIPLRRGRSFDAHDRRGTLPIAIVNEAFARKAWPNENPIGRQITLGQPYVTELADPGPREIVGVVADVREEGLERKAPPMLYVPLAQQNDALTRLAVRILPIALVIRGEGSAASLTQTAQQGIWSVDPTQPVSDVRLMREVVSRSLGSQTFNTTLLGSLAALALLLAAVGLYGVISHLVGQRTREIGIRMALGASQANVLVLFERQALSLVAVGIALGLLGARGLTRFLRSLLTDISPTDPWVFLLAPALLLTIALIAALTPALRAARVDPTRALRAE